MTPKEKANEIVKKYFFDTDISSVDTAIKCSLISIDEVLNVIVVINDYDFEPLNEYWQEVKQEIKKI